jgi:hypothetical protein
MHNQVQYETDKEKGAPKLEPQCIYKARGRHEKREREREREDHLKLVLLFATAS